MAKTRINTWGTDVLGNVIQGLYVEEGITYLPSGARLPVGYTVQVNDDIFKRLTTGGVKVESHNPYVGSPDLTGDVFVDDATGGGTVVKNVDGSMLGKIGFAILGVIFLRALIN